MEKTLGITIAQNKMNTKEIADLTFIAMVAALANEVAQLDQERINKLVKEIDEDDPIMNGVKISLAVMSFTAGILKPIIPSAETVRKSSQEILCNSLDGDSAKAQELLDKIHSVIENYL